ncbi:hypothetical protein [Phyllobacterium sp. UNC302MFCol5.2]|uniref:hypothetical protein n=1 Tax=Phyllobacterium sp. UNC302MFCol5.2 TaxID=1449065 RepID=UPI000482BBB0|nr:hypothetical protein [Phyllobacterium sp. UNC302MFCol5.2]
MNYDQDYLPDLFTGTYLNDLLEAQRTKEFVLTNGSISLQTFQDAKNPQWVISFGGGIPKLRVKPAIGAVLRQAFGPDSKNWIGKRIALSVEPIEWEDHETREMKSGFAIRVRAVADEEPASQPPPSFNSLDDDIPFGRRD